MTYKLSTRIIRGIIERAGEDDLETWLKSLRLKPRDKKGFLVEAPAEKTMALESGDKERLFSLLDAMNGLGSIAREELTGTQTYQKLMNNAELRAEFIGKMEKHRVPDGGRMRKMTKDEILNAIPKPLP